MVKSEAQAAQRTGPSREVSYFGVRRDWTGRLGLKLVLSGSTENGDSHVALQACRGRTEQEQTPRRAWPSVTDWNCLAARQPG